MSSQQYLLENQSQTMAELETENADMKEKLESLVGKQVETSLIDSKTTLCENIKFGRHKLRIRLRSSFSLNWLAEDCHFMPSSWQKPFLL